MMRVSFCRGQHCRGGFSVGQRQLRLINNSVVRRRDVGRLVIVGGKGEYYMCKHCGKKEFKQFYKCPNCAELNSMELKVENKKSFGGSSNGGGGAGPQLVEELNNNQKYSSERNELTRMMTGVWTSSENTGELRSTRELKNSGYTSEDTTRIKIPGEVGNEVNAVLGGGIVPGSAILISGEPGIGKSTLLLQIAGLLAEGWQGTASDYMKAEGFKDSAQGDPKVLYASAEENQLQVNARADRCGFGDLDTLILQHESNLDKVFREGLEKNPSVIIIDSISTIQIAGLDGRVGGMAQVRVSANAICQIAKDRSIPIFTVCHVTKHGDLAGPMQLQHRVDVVLEMSNLTNDGIISLRAKKNRFGSTENVALFKMEEGGLNVIHDANTELLRNWREVEGPGSAVTVITEGNHQLMVEIQAMGSVFEAMSENGQNWKMKKSGGGVVSQPGLDRNNVYKMLGVLQCRTAYKPFKNAWYFNVKGGIKIRDPAMDLGLAMAMVSFIRKMPMPRDLVVIGEVGLLGEISYVKNLKERLITASKQGFKKAIICDTNLVPQNIQGLQIIKYRKINEAFFEVFGEYDGKIVDQFGDSETEEETEEEEEEEFEDEFSNWKNSNSNSYY